MSAFISAERAGQVMSGIGKLSSFLGSVATQIRAAVQVGVPFEDSATARRTGESETTLGPSVAELWDDAPLAA